MTRRPRAFTFKIMPCGRECYPIGVIAIDHMTLATTELGLGTCWIGSFVSGKVREIPDIPRDIHAVQLLLVGYSARRPMRKHRHSL